MKKAARTGDRVHKQYYVANGYTKLILLTSLYHDCEEITSNSAKKSMIFTGYCQNQAAQISLFNRKFEKAWLSALIFEFSLAAYVNSPVLSSKFQTVFAT